MQRSIQLVRLAGHAAVIATALVAGATATADVPQPKGIVVLIADDQGEGDAGCYGNTAVCTPNLDQLARDGTRFDKAFLTTSSCSPSRSSILTGRWPHNTGAEDLHTALPEDQHTIARYLRQQQYYSAAIGKWHLGNAERKNWDRIVECGGEQLAKRALEVFRERPADKPFFFWIASTDPHRGYEKNAIPQPHNPADVHVPPYLPDDPRVREDLAMYYDEITRFDDAVGQILDAVDQAGLRDDTLVFYLSDNGMPFPRAKTTLYDSGIHTPLLVRWPAVVEPLSVCQGLVSSIDIAPTVLELAGVTQSTTQGRSLLPLLRDSSATGHRAVYAEANWHDYEQFTRAVRTRRFKLVRNYYWDKPLWHPADSVNSVTWQAMQQLHAAGQLPVQHYTLTRTPRPFEELYDLDRDPHEMHNVCDDPQYREQLLELRAMLDNWRVATNDTMPARRRLDGFTLDGEPLPFNQPFYNSWRRNQERRRKRQ